MTEVLQNQTILALDGGFDAMVLSRVLQSLDPPALRFAQHSQTDLPQPNDKEVHARPSAQEYNSKELEQHFATYVGLLDSQPILAGVGTGALLSLYLASLDPNQTSYSRLSQGVIFSDFLHTQLLPKKRQLLRVGTGLGPVINSKEMRAILEAHFDPDLTLGELHLPVALVGFQLLTPDGKQRMKIQMINNFDTSSPFINMSVIDAALISMAYPIAGSIWKHRLTGGIFANNPSLLTLVAWLRSKTHHISGERIAKKVTGLLNKITILSIGRQNPRLGGDRVNAILGSSNNLPWGWLMWFLWPGKPLMELNALSNGNISRTNYNCHRLLGYNQYFRLGYNTPRLNLIQSFTHYLFEPLYQRIRHIEHQLDQWQLPQKKGGTQHNDKHFDHGYHHTLQWLHDNWHTL